jgi:hypothetical protein
MRISIRLVSGVVVATLAGIVSVYVLWTLDTGVGARPGQLIDLTPSGAVSDDGILPFKQIPTDVLPDDTSKNPIVEPSDQTSASVLFMENDITAGRQNGTRVRISESTNEYDLNLIPQTDFIDVNGVTVVLQFGDGYSNSFFAIWNQASLGFSVEFVHLSQGSVDQVTPAARESYVSTVRSLIPRLATS